VRFPPIPSHRGGRPSYSGARILRAGSPVVLSPMSARRHPYNSVCVDCACFRIARTRRFVRPGTVDPTCTTAGACTLGTTVRCASHAILTPRCSASRAVLLVLCCHVRLGARCCKTGHTGARVLGMQTSHTYDELQATSSGKTAAATTSQAPPSRLLVSPADKYT
jgi:hypothetical protein